MNLDHTSRFDQIDTQGMLSHIDGLPDQLISAWQLGSQLAFTKSDSIERVVVAGMGGSAIGADLVAVQVRDVDAELLDRVRDRHERHTEGRPDDGIGCATLFVQRIQRQRRVELAGGGIVNISA